MISVLIFCHKKKEADILHKLCGYCTGMMGAEMQVCDIYGASLRKQTERTAEHGHSWDILIFEISSEEDLSELKRLRNIFPEAELLIIASPRISPERYMVPSLHPIMLLMQPVNRQRALEAIRQVLTYHYRRREREMYTHRLFVRIGEERRYFHYTQILYLEAREKKLILHSGQEELSFYGSLREMEKVLPEYFVRCHRSYIVNFMHISRLDLSQDLLYIDERFVIPISKKYKNNVNILPEDRVKITEKERITGRKK